MMNSPAASQRGSKPKMVGPYVLGRPLGFGTTSRVHLAIHSVTKSAAAVKIIRKRQQLDLRKLQREISILRLLKHRFITQLYDVFESKNHIYMVMELVDGGELFDHIIQQKRLRRGDALRVFRQVAEATHYFHSLGIVHRDIKPENILVHSSGDIKIADFGFATARRDGILKTSCGSPHYACPEVCSSSTYDGTKADSWSLGVLLFVLVTGDFPFNDQNYSALFHKIQTGKYVIPSYVDQDIADLITRLLTVDPDLRLSVDGILAHRCMLPYASKSTVDANSTSQQNGIEPLPFHMGDRKEYKRGSVRTSDAGTATSATTATTTHIADTPGTSQFSSNNNSKDSGWSTAGVVTSGGKRTESHSRTPSPSPSRIRQERGVGLVKDQRAMQELVYLGWADSVKEVELALDGKNPDISPTIRTAYCTLLAKFKAGAATTGNSTNHHRSPTDSPSSQGNRRCAAPAQLQKLPPPTLGDHNRREPSGRSWGAGNNGSSPRIMDVCSGGPTAAAAAAVTMDRGPSGGRLGERTRNPTMLRGGRVRGEHHSSDSKTPPAGCFVQ